MEEKRGYPTLLIAQHFCPKAMLEKKQEEKDLVVATLGLIVNNTN